MSLMNMNFQRCIVCGKDVETSPQVSASQSKYTDLDFRPRGNGRFIEKNYVQFCPNCGYSAYKLDRDLLYGNRAFLQSAEYKQIVQDENLIIDAKKFYLLGLIQENNNDKQKAATAFLRAGWFFQDNGNQEWMIKSKEKAIENMISSDFTWSNTQLVAILVDMLRTIGKFDEAIKVIEKYGFDNIKEEDEIKLFKYQIKLCEIKDSASHAIYEIDQETN